MKRSGTSNALGGFDTNSYVTNVYFKTRTDDLAPKFSGSWSNFYKYQSLFNKMETGSVVENCVFDVSYTCPETFTYGSFFCLLKGTFKNNVIIDRSAVPVAIADHFTSAGTIENIVVINNVVDRSKALMAGTDGTNNSNFSGLDGKLLKQYYYTSVENAIEGNGTAFEGDTVTYEGNTYTAKDWWTNKVDINGDGTTDDTKRSLLQLQRRRLWQIFSRLSTKSISIL